MKYTNNQIRDLINDLKKPVYGHGAFGEPERHDPSKKDLMLAEILEEILEEREAMEGNCHEISYTRSNY